MDNKQISLEKEFNEITFPRFRLLQVVAILFINATIHVLLVKTSTDMETVV